MASRKPSEDIEQYKRVLTESGLVNEDQLSNVLNELELEHGNRTGDSTILARRLLDRNIVTEWQNTHLMEGRHKGFFLGRYKLLGHLGAGGMSTVYLAEHVHMRRRVAIKVLAEVNTGNSAKVSRFFVESQAIAALDHPNIVRAHDFDTDGRFHYLVMEYVDGPDLQKLVDTKGRPSFEVAADYIRQAALGLHHAHQRGMVHRDIKPANLLLDPTGVVKILDMGVARITNREDVSLTLEQGIDMVGTVDYLAPEQALDSHRVDARADLYSLGCTLAFLLTGHAPFPVGTQAQRLLKHQMETPDIGAECPDVPRELVAVATKMMGKLPEERHNSAEAVAEVLADWLNQRASAGAWTGPPPGTIVAPTVRAMAETVAGKKENTLMVRSDASSSSIGLASASQIGIGNASLSQIGSGGDRVTFSCENCGSTVKAPAAHAGKLGRCPKCGEKTVIPTPEVRGRVELLKELLENMLSAVRNNDDQWFHKLVEPFPLPKPELWFQHVLGAERGPLVAAEYAQQTPRVETSLWDFFTKMLARAKEQVSVRRIERAGRDEPAQVNELLMAMKEPVVVYSARFSAEQESKGGGILLASFVFVKQEFRFIGPLRSLQKPAG